MPLIIAIAMVAALPSLAHAGPAVVTLTLDVPPDQAPQYLCVVGPDRSCLAGAVDASGKLTHEDRCQTRELEDLVKANSLVVDAAGKTGSFGVGPDTAGLPGDLADALVALGQVPSGKCSEEHAGCTPQISLDAFVGKDKKPTARIVCGKDNSVQTGRVAIVAIQFHDAKLDRGVAKVVLQAATASITLDTQPKPPFFMQVIGGHYAPSARGATIVGDRVSLSLQPRCQPFIVELPPQLPTSITSVTLNGSQCTADPTGDLTVQIPFSATPKRSTLTVDVGSATDRATYEASWTDSLPARPFRLGVRALDFAWHPDCLSGMWSDTEIKKAPKTAKCPRATIAEAGQSCVMFDDSDDECRYHCTAIPGATPFALPVGVQLDRMRPSPTPLSPVVKTLLAVLDVLCDGVLVTEDVVYSWHDTIHVGGEHLRSFPAPADRKLFLELTPPDRWNDHWGDGYDAVRVVLPDGSAENVELTKTNKTEGDRLAWYEISAPGIMCTDRVRVAVFGSHIYDEHSVPANGGRIVLEAPDTAESRLNLWLSGGVGFTNDRLPGDGSRFETTGQIGGLLEKYMGPGAGEISGIVGLSKIGSPRGGSIEEVGFVRVDVRVGYELWIVPGFRAGAAIGGGLASPMFNHDDGKLGTMVPSFVSELNIRFRLARSVGLFGEASVGLRLGETRQVFETDVSGPSTTIQTVQPFFAFRAWFHAG